MTALPPPQNSASVLIDTHHEANAEPPRPHMGCSLLGHPCDRYLWLSFRHAVQESFSGRMLRLFRRGQNEESVVVSDLRAIGVDVQATGASQSRVKFDCHVSGSVDGIIESGLPESPKKRHILEIKTYNRKSFDKLAKDGVQKTKFQHYVQMQLYMHAQGLTEALYLAVNKDTDELYGELVSYDRETAERYLQRAQSVIDSPEPPTRVNSNASWYQCKFCAAHEFCHSTLTTKHVNCRTSAATARSTDGEEDTTAAACRTYTTPSSWHTLMYPEAPS